MNAVEISNISKRYRIGHQAGNATLRDSITSGARKIIRRESRTSTEDFWALKDINFTIPQGQRIGIIGRNGAGKSTLLKIISRITTPTTGEGKLHGRVASLLEVGTGFHPELSGRENIYLNGAILGMTRKEIQKKFDEIVTFSEIEKFLDTPVKRYSSGMYVRLAFAVAAHLDSDIFIVDEVLAVGDAQFQKKCLGKMQDVASKGRTVIFVSHNLPSIRSLCSRAILLQGGKIQSDGTTHNVLEKYIGRGGLVPSRLWEPLDAPKNTTTRIDGVRVCDSKGVTLQSVTTDDEFQVEINYEVVKDLSAVGLTVLVANSDREMVFSSINNHEKDWYGKPMPTGKFMSRCTVPSKFLNDGEHTISLIFFGKNFSDAITIEDALRIFIEDGKYVRGDFYGDYQGATRPLLSWKTNKQ